MGWRTGKKKAQVRDSPSPTRAKLLPRYHRLPAIVVGAETSAKSIETAFIRCLWLWPG